MQMRERAGQVAGAPFNVAKVALRYSVGVVGDTREIFLPSKAPIKFVADLRKEQFDHEVTLARDTYESGRQRKDPELGFFGGGWLMKLLCHGADSKHVPSHKVDGLARYVTDERLDPILEPYLSDEEAIFVADLLQKKSVVQDLFPTHKPTSEGKR